MRDDGVGKREGEGKGEEAEQGLREKMRLELFFTSTLHVRSNDAANETNPTRSVSLG